MDTNNEKSVKNSLEQSSHEGHRSEDRRIFTTDRRQFHERRAKVERRFDI